MQNLQAIVDKIKYMKKILFASALITLCCLPPKTSLAWGKKGHELTGAIAWHFLDDTTRQIVKDYLDMSFEDAANWMDDVRSNSFFEFQRTWHYVDFERGEKYHPTHERDLMTVLHSSIAQIKQYKTIKKKDVRRALLLIFHLVGDMHQPLHCGYNSDRGGNDIAVTSKVVSGNLHSIWDTDIINYKGIDIDSCVAVYNTLDSNEMARVQKINELSWMYESRSYLDTVYSFQNNFLDVSYVDSNSKIIKKQLLYAGLRLAALMKSVFNPDVKPEG